MTNEFDFEWEAIDTTGLRKKADLHDHEIYLKKGSGKNFDAKRMYNKAIISRDLIAESSWKAGDRVTIMKAKGVSKVYAIRRQNEGNGKGELKLVNSGDQICLTGINLMLKFEYAINGDVFSAWYDKGKDMIIFRPKKEA